MFQKEDLISKSNEYRSKYFPNPKHYRRGKIINIYIKSTYGRFLFSIKSDTMSNHVEDDTISIMESPQLYFDDYTSGTGKTSLVILREALMNKFYAKFVEFDSGYKLQN